MYSMADTSRPISGPKMVLGFTATQRPHWDARSHLRLRFPFSTALNYCQLLFLSPFYTTVTATRFSVVYKTSALCFVRYLTTKLRWRIININITFQYGHLSLLSFNCCFNDTMHVTHIITWCLSYVNNNSAAFIGFAGRDTHRDDKQCHRAQ
jgi:hypothetical protein